MSKFTHLIKLSVGTEDVSGLERWQKSGAAKTADGLPCHVTRMWPKRQDEVLNGGSIYWVIKGLIQCRQKIVRLDEVLGGDGISRCAIVLDPEMVRVAPTQKRPFQGWRYLAPSDAPVDLGAKREDEPELPAALSAALAEIGIM